MMDFEIDMVYLWVDGNDPEWRRRHNATIGITDAESSANCDGRFADNDELKFSLRSLEMFASWIHKIFIVTDRQVPHWLDTTNDKIQIVDHTEILSPEALPTFNSRIIEHALFRIPGLSEHFLYGNDDMFFNRPVVPSDFFTPEGDPIVRLSRRPLRKLSNWFRENIQHKPLSNYNNAIRNSALLIEREYGKYIGGKTHHNIDAYCRSLYETTFEKFRKDIEPTLTNRKRSLNDIQRNIYTYLPMVEKKCKVEYVTKATSFRLHIHRHKHYEALERKQPLLFCVNDSEYACVEDRCLAKEYLLRRFPTPSSFELKEENQIISNRLDY